MRCKLYFNNFLIKINCSGSMVFDHNNETLLISVRLFFNLLFFIKHSQRFVPGFVSQHLLCDVVVGFVLFNNGKRIYEIFKFNSQFDLIT